MDADSTQPCKFVAMETIPASESVHISIESTINFDETSNNLVPKLERSFSTSIGNIKSSGSSSPNTTERVITSSVEVSQSLNLKSKTDHIYEEVGSTKESHLVEYNILDYYEKYSPTTAKTLINTLFLPRHKICNECASLQAGPVYTDTLIYGKKPLYAKEVEIFYRENALQFKHSIANDKTGNTLFSQLDDTQDCMLVYNYSKTHASSIFYTTSSPEDVFNLHVTLKPNILLLNNLSKTSMNTHLYHRSVNNFYVRTSNHGSMPMNFCLPHDNVLPPTKHVGYNADLQNWMNYRSDIFRSQYDPERGSKQDDVPEYRANRSSLLLLEPLLLMPDLTTAGQRQIKNRIPHAEHMKIVKIVVAYTLSFIILTVITFYIVYFT